ncbi:MAG: hypothetical protein HRT47_01575 [Candidatus Caenarcaniphilales bacterium]|nr:hypothetical protein [Candidatus Caenarcaniphilales bacterium]
MSDIEMKKRIVKYKRVMKSLALEEKVLAILVNRIKVNGGYTDADIDLLLNDPVQDEEDIEPEAVTKLREIYKAKARF